MDPTACKALKGDVLYILEIFVDSVSIYAEKLEKVSPTSLGVDLQLIDFPLFRIFQSDFLLTKPDRGKDMTREGRYRIVNFNAGKMFSFTRNPGELIEKMRTKPMLLDVYVIKEIVKCPEGVLKEPLGNTKIPIPGCLCDHVMMATNDVYHLPRSYVIKNTFGLVDQEYKPSGLITLFLSLTCLGTYMTSAFSIVGKKLLFKNSGSFNEFLCTKISYPDEDERRKAEEGKKFCLPDVVFEESELDLPPVPSNIAGLVLTCNELAKRDGYPFKIIPPNYPIKIPDTEVEEIKFEEGRRPKGFVDTSFPSSEVVDRFYLKQGTCVSTGCAGNICTGLK